MTTRIIALAFASLLVAASDATAQDIRITTFKGESTYSLNGRPFTVTRDQNPNALLEGDFARTSRACPPNCLQPLSAGSGVATLGELEVLSFLENDVTQGNGLLIDARSRDEFSTQSIPGAVNVPFETLDASNRYRDDILQALGAIYTASGELDFDNAMALAIFSGGVWSPDAPAAIDFLLAAGYPANKLFYYRGGLQAWVHVGLTTQPSSTPG